MSRDRIYMGFSLIVLFISLVLSLYSGISISIVLTISAMLYPLLYFIKPELRVLVRPLSLLSVLGLILLYLYIALASIEFGVFVWIAILILLLAITPILSR